MKRQLATMAAMGLLLAGCSSVSSDSANDAQSATAPASAAESSAAETAAEPSESENAEESSPAESTESADEQSSDETSSPTDRKMSERGNLIREVGQEAQLTNTDDETQEYVSFTVTDLEPNFTCTSEWAEKSLNGNFVAVSIEAQISTELPDSGIDIWDFNPYDFKFYTPDGVRENDAVGNGYSCLNDSEVLPMTLYPGDNVAGKLVFDVSSDSGLMVYSPSFIDIENGSGWEWEY